MFRRWFWSVPLLLLVLTPIPLAAQDTPEKAPSEEIEDDEAEEKDAREKEEADEREKVPVARMDPITVTATRTPSRVFESPHSITIIGRDDFTRRRQVRNLPEVFKETPGVMVQQTARGHGSPFIRGFTGNANLVLIDGVRLNSAAYRGGPIQYLNTVDPWAVDQIELMRGPAAVPWGSDALGGTIYLKTLEPGPFRDADDALGLPYGEHFTAMWRSRFSSADEGWANRLEVSGRSGPFSVIGGFTYRDFNDLRIGRGGDAPNTAYSRRDGDVKAIWKATENTKVVLAYQSHRMPNTPRTHKTLYANPYRTVTIGDEVRRDTTQRRDLVYLQAHADEMDGWLSGAHASLSWHRQEEVFKKVKDDTEERSGFTSNMLGSWIQLESPLMELGTLTYGGEYYRDNVDSHRIDSNFIDFESTIRPRGAVADDSAYDQVGLFLEADLELHEYVDLLLGLRYQLAHVNANDVDPDPTDNLPIPSLDRTYDAVVGSGRVTVKPLDWLHVVAGISQGFRAPNLDDTTAFRDRRTATFDVPSPNLDSERTVTYEAGIKLDHDWFRGSAFYFYTQLRDFIGRVPTGTVVNGSQEFRKDNFSDGFIQGVELEAAVALTEDWQWSLFGNFAWVEGKGDTLVNGIPKSDVRLSRMPPVRGLIGIRWEYPEELFWAEFLAIFTRHQELLSPRDAEDTQRIPTRLYPNGQRDGGTPGYPVYTLRGGAKLFQDRLRLSLALENLTDHNYRVHGSGVNGPGFNALFTVELRYW